MLHDSPSYMSAVLDREALQGLRQKYAEMLRLRDLDAAGGAPDPRAAMRALAARFPGALREIDELPRELLAERLEAVERALGDPSHLEDWMIAIARYHARLRLALRVRRVIPARTLEAARALDDPEVDALDDASLAAIVRPPDGRLNRVVLAIVARELGSSVRAIESLLTSARRRT